jgi:hypothetical protein
MVATLLPALVKIERKGCLAESKTVAEKNR